jgi:hypothetical protein
MRGPWTSGGIEANYGIFGHTTNVATPVDYVTRTNADGSVSCIIGALDLLTRTMRTTTCSPDCMCADVVGGIGAGVAADL